MITAKQSFGYYCALIWRVYCIGAPAAAFDILSRWHCPFQVIQTIRVMDPISETRGYFVGAVESALNLILTSDPVRFKRVQKEIHNIVSARTSSISCYGRPSKTCSIDFRRFYFEDDSKMAISLLASTLIYEATWGHLYSKGILWVERNHLRFEDLCRNEARRFLQRLGVSVTLWDADQFVVLKRVGFQNIDFRDIYEIFVQDPSEEAAIWKKSGMPYYKGEDKK